MVAFFKAYVFILHADKNGNSVQQWHQATRMTFKKGATFCLKGFYVPSPTQDTWDKIAEGFKDRWNFPNCTGALDKKTFESQLQPVVN